MIRNAVKTDVNAIRLLLIQLGYPVNTIDLEKQLETVGTHQDHQVLVYEMNSKVVGFIAIYFVPSLAIDDALAVVNYLAVDEKHIGHGIGKALEQEAEKLAWDRQCDRIQVHYQLHREKAHGFYKSRGYQEYPVLYQKRLIYAE